jgi:hypothetical protein
VILFFGAESTKIIARRRGRLLVPGAHAAAI